MPFVLFGETKIEYITKLSEKRKTIGISVDYDNGVVVTLPKTISQEEIEKVVLNKAAWILNQLHNFSEVITKPTENEFVSGEKYLYLGRAYRLKVNQKEEIKKPSITFHRGKFYVIINTKSKEEKQIKIVRNLLHNWFLQKSESLLKERGKILSLKTGIKPQGFVIKDQQKRWGSCSQDGTININWRIIMAPISVIDYIIIHELCHLKYPGHSNKFWKEVSIFCPNFQKSRDWLRIKGPRLVL